MARANSCFLRRSVTTTSGQPLKASKLIKTQHTPPRSYSESKRSMQPLFIGRGSHVADELAGTLVETHHRPLLVVGLLVEIQDLLHPPHESSALSGRDHPLALEVGLERVFLSVRLTLSWERASTWPSSTMQSAKSLRLHLSLPSGGSEHERATR